MAKFYLDKIKVSGKTLFFRSAHMTRAAAENRRKALKSRARLGSLCHRCAVAAWTVAAP